MIDRSLRILLVEDDPGDARLVRIALQEAGRTNVDLQTTRTLEAAEQLLAGDEFDVVLLDLGLPGCVGLDALRAIHRHVCDVAIVVLTSNTAEALATDALSEGAQDYLRKDEITPSGLQRVLRYATQRHEVLVQLQQTTELLNQKNRRLAQLHETAHQFVDHVSHEFRTPLTVIKEFVTIVRDGLAGQVSQQQRKFLEIVNDRADDLAIIVDDMLDVSKLESGHLSVWRRQSKLDEVFGHVCPALERKAAIKEINLDVSLDADLPVVFCDPDKIGRVLVNLAVNAIKFCDKNGTVKLWARAAPESAEVIVGVTDNGAGISPENLQRIFERFHQVDGVSRCSTKGFGLGLSIAKELVALNFGHIDVESELGKGSTFSFTVPLFKPEELVGRCLRRIEQLQPMPASVTLITASVKPSVEPAATNVVDEFLHHAFRGDDLVLRTQPHKWIIVANCPQQEVDDRCNRVLASWAEANQARPRGILPEIELRSEGTWQIPTEREEIVAACHTQLAAKEIASRSAKVLIVDDDREMLRGLSLRLEASGYEILTACDGAEAIRLAGEHHPDAILMDNYMPVMDGLEALIRLGEQPDTTDIPVIMISASRRDERKALQQGARFFLQKPCALNTLFSALQDVIENPVSAGVC